MFTKEGSKREYEASYNYTVAEVTNAFVLVAGMTSMESLSHSGSNWLPPSLDDNTPPLYKKVNLSGERGTGPFALSEDQHPLVFCLDVARRIE
jgi:hypothetical protein